MSNESSCKNFLIYLTIASNIFSLNFFFFVFKLIEKKRKKRESEEGHREATIVNHIFIGYLDGADPFRALVSCSMESIYKFPSIRGTA